MKSKITLFILLTFLYFTGWTQQLTQTVRGTLTDSDSKSPLIGAAVTIAGSNPMLGTVTDVNGEFRLTKIPVGRITLQLSYLGYESQTIPNIVVNSGKEVVLDLMMQESTIKMEEVVVTANQDKGDAVNEMAIVSARSISLEETSRFTSTFNDPARVLSNYAGVTSTQDGSNDIIVRGNSPKYVQWRLEGIQITNPNHFADQANIEGAISILNNNLLATSDFYTGAFAPEYGDALSGVYDIRLRAGNNEKFESQFGFGLLGTDFTVEGPLKKNYGGSFLANYRYSTVAIISDLGLVDINGIPKFQDATYKMVLPTKNIGTFSIFGIGGISEFYFEDVTPDVWETPGDRGFINEISQDASKESFLINQGLNHTLNFNNDSYFHTSLSYSAESIRDKIFEYDVYQVTGANGELEDSLANKIQNFDNTITKSVVRGAISYHNKINAKHKIQVGTKYALFAYDFNQSRFLNAEADRFAVVDFNEQISTVRNFVSWKYRLNDDVTFISGIHNMNVLYNKKSTLEPRIAMSWRLGTSSSFHAGYGLHSTMESVHNYFTRIEQPDGGVLEPNKNLDLLKAHHYVLGFKKRLTPKTRMQVELYYQDLFNLPVANNDTSYYATINESINFTYVDLVNKGTGTNYGVELTLERFFNDNYYYMLNGSLYESKYKSLEGVERNTTFNGNYLVNLLAGKEWLNLGKRENQTLNINTKVFFGGGKKILPLLRDAQGNVDVDPANNRVWDYDNAYERSLEDAYLINVSVSYKWNNPKATHEAFLNLDNVTNNKSKIQEFYAPDQPGSVGYLTQFGFFPNLMYRVYF